jgi:hypothetical protein
MKIAIAIVIIALVAFGGWKIFEQWQKVEEGQQQPAPQAVLIPDTQLPGMDGNLESALDNARRRGASGLRDFLKQHGGRIRDPRLASIQLDYVVLVAKEDLAEARNVFAKVKERTDGSSPVYPRVKQLEKTFD